MINSDEYSWNGDASLPTHEQSFEPNEFVIALVRYGNDDAFANLIEDWKPFKAPTSLKEIQNIVHDCPSIALPDEDASVEEVQRFIYRSITLRRHGMFKDYPIARSHPDALKRFVLNWNIDGKTLAGLKYPEKFVERLRDEATYTKAQRVLIDIIWREICWLKNEAHSSLLEIAEEQLQESMSQLRDSGNILESSIDKDCVDSAMVKGRTSEASITPSNGAITTTKNNNNSTLAKSAFGLKVMKVVSNSIRRGRWSMSARSRKKATGNGEVVEL